MSEQNDTCAEIEKLKLTGANRQTEFTEFERGMKEKTKTGEIRAEALKSSLSNIDGNQVRLLAPVSGWS